jgi:hypothetical protein
VHLFTMGVKKILAGWRGVSKTGVFHTPCTRVVAATGAFSCGTIPLELHCRCQIHLGCEMSFCKAVTENGKLCVNEALPNSDCCKSHQPADKRRLYHRVWGFIWNHKGYSVLIGFVAPLLYLLGIYSNFLQVFSYYTQDIKKDTSAVIKPLLDNSSQEIAKRFDDITNESNGGDSYAYFIHQTHMYTSDSEPRSYNDVKLQLHHYGKFPLYDIQIELVDIQKLHKLLSEHFKLPIPWDNFIAERAVFTKIDRLDPSRMVEVFKLDLPANADRWNFNVFFDARNGKWVQELRFLRAKNGPWGLAHRTIRMGKVLEEQGSEALPKDVTGKPKWD